MPCSAHPPPVRFSFNRLTTRDILLLNQRRNPLRMDPTRTTLIRSRFVADMRKRFRKLKRDVNEFMIQLDALGLKDRHSFLTGNQPQPREFEFRTDAGKVSAFNEWFRQQVEADVLSVPSGTPIGEPWTAKYVESAYRRGLANSYIASRQAGVAGELGILTQSQEAFLRSSFLQPETISKVELLATRSFEQLRGVTSQMGADMNRILAQGIADGRGPRVIAKEMSERIDSMSRTRATVIARTEVINAHAEGQLDAFEELGVEEVGVKAEWSTAGDDRVCSECAAMEGEVFEVSESHGLIPLHPNCRCAWIPAEEGAKATGRRPGVAGGDRGLIDEAAGKLGDIEGNSVVSVIRAAGAQGMTFQETKEMLSQAGFSSADQTIRIQLRAGKLGKGSLAPTSLLNRLRTGQIVGPTPVPTTTAPVPSAVRPGAVTPPATKGVKYRTAAEYREALLAPAEAAKSPELDRQRAELRQKTREISKLYADRNALRHAGQDTSAISVQIREAEARRNALDSIVRSNDRGRSISAQEARELLMESDSLKGKVKLPDNLSKRDREAIEETLSMMPAKSYTAQEREALADLIVKTETDPNKLGSYQHPAPGWGATMRVKPEANVSTTVHEYAHHISYSVPRVMKDQNAFFNRRTAGESIAPLPGYNSSGKKDLFGKTDVYAGRVYSDGRYPEVIAVGVEELYKNPIRFATNDPEYFDMVVRTLKGID